MMAIDNIKCDPSVAHWKETVAIAYADIALYDMTGSFQETHECRISIQISLSSEWHPNLAVLINCLRKISLQIEFCWTSAIPSSDVLAHRTWAPSQSVNFWKLHHQHVTNEYCLFDWLETQYGLKDCSIILFSYYLKGGSTQTDMMCTQRWGAETYVVINYSPQFLPWIYFHPKIFIVQQKAP